MKIAIIVDIFPSLSETFVLNQITGLIQRGQDVYIFPERAGNYTKEHEDYKNYNLSERTIYPNNIPKNKFIRLLKGIRYIIRYAPKNFRAIFKSLNAFKYGREALSLTLLFQIVPFLKKGPFDVIHCQFGTLGLKAVLLKQIGAINCKIVTSIRGFDITSVYRKRPDIYNELFKEGDLFLPVSHSLMERLISAGCDQKKIEVHYSGIDCSKFRYLERRLVDGEPVKVLTVARLVEKKGVAFAIEAVARLISKGKRILYLVVGDGALRDDLQEMTERLGVVPHVKLLGWKTQEEVYRLLQEAHILMAPSVTSSDGDQEGIPNVVKEAMVSGLPVISTLHSGIPELVADGISGFLVPERDVDSLADSLTYLIDHPEAWAEMGRQGRHIVKDRFDITKLNNRLLEIYKGLSANKPFPSYPVNTTFTTNSCFGDQR
jgi:colanic acid/amylovoran biosynthesis glycosyltransferase